MERAARRGKAALALGCAVLLFVLFGFALFWFCFVLLRLVFVLFLFVVLF